MRWALITGTSTGIGRAIALKLLREGVSVFAGIRKEDDAVALLDAAAREPSAGSQIIPLRLDVARADQIEKAVQTIAVTTAQDGLWALINNAGIVVPGPVEHLSAEDWQRQFDVNFFGAVAVTRASLPLLRLAVLVQGIHVPRILFVSSIGGRVAQPILAPYTSSKFALSALGDSLRLELRRQGIGVTVLEPGAVATPIWQKGDNSALAFSATHPARDLYSPEIDGLTALARKTAAAAIPPGRVAEIAVRALLRRQAPARVLAGTDAKIGAILRKWLPQTWFEAILLRQFGIGNLPVEAAKSSGRLTP